MTSLSCYLDDRHTRVETLLNRDPVSGMDTFLSFSGPIQ